MGLCESARSPWGSSAALGAGVGVMLLGLCLAQSTAPQAACPAAASLQTLTQPQYQNITQDIGASFMAALVQSFLHTVQPKPFPGDLILQITKNPNQDVIKEVLVYEIGFLVCAAIGILYIVLMPIVGFFLACCRCCGNCGGKMYQKQTSSIHCRRRALYWSAFITTVIILFRPTDSDHTLNDLWFFCPSSSLQQVNYVVNESYSVIQKVTSNLDAIGPQLGTAIQQQIKGVLFSALYPVRLLNQETVNISAQLTTLNSSLAQLQFSLKVLQNNLTNVRNSINATLSNPNCTGCGSKKSELQKLTLDTSINVSTGSKQQLANIEKQVSQFVSNSALSALSNVPVKQVQTDISNITPDVERAEQIRWGVSLAICCIVLLVVICYLLGLLLGPLGLIPRADTTKRSCTADCGGIFLMMGAGFSFLFSWLFMIVVLLLFLLGGNIYTLVCQPWSNGQLLKFIDTPGLIPNFNLSQALGLKTDLSISNIYKDCEQNKPVWTTLHLYELINLDDLLNVSKYTEQIQQQFDNTNMNLSSITLLSPQVKNQLSNFSSKAISFDSTAVTQQMNNISSINLNTSAAVLENLAGTSVKKSELYHQEPCIDDRRNQCEYSGSHLDLPVIEISSNFFLFMSFGSFSLLWLFQRTVGEVLTNVGIAQDFLNTNTTQIIKIESRSFLDCQLNYFTAYADWANLTITQQVGRCQPVAGAVDSVETILCSQMVESLNAFWFSLGWCLIFFIPSIIFSIKLAKFYRRMNNQIIMTHIPRAQMKAT
uniref:Prominin 2 n=1 Tax=Anabas testudineus TaxID=64144 RepID=A0A7N6AUY0_ANATE